jgi:hypothetical protein
LLGIEIPHLGAEGDSPPHSPAPGPWLPLTGTTEGDHGSERTVTDPNATGAAKFCHVEITKP